MIHNSSFIGVRNAALIMKSFQQDTQQLPSLEELQKGGEGSKGGKVIGHTKSGKPVYANKHSHEYTDFTNKDHLDARNLHQELHEEWQKQNPKKHHTNSLHGKRSIEHSSAADGEKGSFKMISTR